MGASQSACKPGGTPARPGGPRVVSVVRSSAWGLGAEEDVWPVEILGTATLAELKVKIEELYEVPVQVQKLTRASDPSTPALEDNVKVETLEHQRVYLLPAMFTLGELGMPSPEQQSAFAGMAQAFLGPLQESMEVNAAMQESLKDVTYKVHFQRPREAGGRAAGKTITLNVDALALVGTVQEMVEVEFFGATGAEPTFLTLEGRLLPPYAPLHYASVEDGKTVTVAKERPPLNEQEQLLSNLLSGVAGGGARNVGVAPEQFQLFQQQFQELMGGLLNTSNGGTHATPEQFQQQLVNLFGPLGGNGATTGAGAGVTPEQCQQFQQQLQQMMTSIFGAATGGGMVPPQGTASGVPPVVPPANQSQRR